jgi:hypothetical protein
MMTTFALSVGQLLLSNMSKVCRTAKKKQKHQLITSQPNFMETIA